MFDGYADGTWFGFLADFITDVFSPQATVFMSVVVVFELVVAALIAGRDRWVDLGVGLSLVWVVAILPFLAWPYLLVNVALVVAQGVLLLRHFDHTLWQSAWPAGHGSGEALGTAR